MIAIKMTSIVIPKCIQIFGLPGEGMISNLSSLSNLSKQEVWHKPGPKVNQ